MMRNAVIIYDDSRKPGKEIAGITGGKSFGETIYKRRTLRERVAEAFSDMPGVAGFYDVGSREIADIKDTPVILYYSDFGIANLKELETIVYKAGYAHENYKITHMNRIACVIYKDAASYFASQGTDPESFTEIKSGAFTDLSDVGNFRSFITGGFDARFFNSLTGDEYCVVKSSEKKQKIKAEYMFYGLLPDDMKQWFARGYDYKEDEHSASYRMQRYHMTDLAIRYVHSSVSYEEFREILGHLFHFISHRRSVPVTAMEYEAEAKRLYVTKVYDRCRQLKDMDGYDVISALIGSLTRFSDIDEIVKRYVNAFDGMRERMVFDHVKTVSHGDLCFSNILYSHPDSLMIFIDPKGALTEDELYMDPYYDLAKLSHSICGHYDYFNSGLYEITVDEDMSAHVRVDADNRQYVAMFRESLSAAGIDFRLVRLYEASLFLSMLPFHMDRPQKVFGFILNAIAILDSLEK
ncbi:MAG: aminoglycoside phosphotransferase family protein [Lachnospiraceae bacterium]|nr:aminoglycoside phosphotransferase family protein [Lachnospiraceae bacterium]